ncbi:putative mediator of RNA polymerase II transcription subunit 26 [Onthophagus taurus]|uniref:putative mediator of RNA polymerase II transcription subunit 26 n=1 Tax=Onthophagus taurus TaxID=166361 RepID=UPI0039BE2CD4
MDVITNALEGQVRQYFQGLPTASSSTASPTYQQPTQATSQSNNERPSVPYWPPHPDSRVQHDTRPKDVISEANSSHQSVPHEPTGKSNQSYYNPPNGANYVEPQYQHYREYQQSSHILPNPSYQQRVAPTQRVQEPSYHQMQTPTSYYQNHRSYYKPVTSNNVKTVVTSQNQNQYDGFKYQSGMANNYAGNKNVKTTHNLPPIAGLQSNYAGFKTKKVTQGIPRPNSEVIFRNSNYHSSSNYQQHYSQSSNQTNQQQNVQNVQNVQSHQQNMQNVQNHQQNVQNVQNQQQSHLQNHLNGQHQSQQSNHQSSHQLSHQQNQLQNQQLSHLVNQQQNQMQNRQQNQIENHQHNQIQNHQHNQIQNQQNQLQNHLQQTQQHNQIQNHQQNQLQNHQQQNQIQNHQQNHQQLNQQQNQLQNQINNQQLSNHLVNHQQSSQQNHQLSHQLSLQVTQASIIHQNNSSYQSASIKNEFPPTQINNSFDSVLDLSLKTIKTPADSTLDDNNMSSEERNQPKYVPMRRYDQRNNVVRSGSVTSAPKVDFTPNFNRPLTHSQPISYNNNNNQERRNYPYYNQNQSHNNLNTSRYYSPIRKETLPRIDFPSSNQIQKSQGMYVHQNQDQRKRLSSESMPVLPKKPKVDEKWRQAIDKQIEQKFSMYQKNSSSEKKSSMINGNLTYQTNQFQQRQYQMHQTYVPSPGVPQYPVYHQQNLPRSNSQSSLNRLSGSHQNVQGADKRVISILRSNLEMKGAKEAQRRQDQKVFNNSNQIQQPSTDVLAPLQPKTAILSRQNVSPFTASSIERNTPPISGYKFPKAVDSIRFDLDEKPGCSSLGNQNDLDGLAANLAARIRTKGELKQMQQIQLNQLNHVNQINQIKTELIKIEEPPKLTKEKLLYPPRRRVFNRDDEQSDKVGKIPPRDRTGMRSSSETSVFDFPDSDSDTEMPVLERQSLEDMRRDRKITSKSILDEGERSLSPLDDTFDKACDNFMEQLKTGGGKKRGRRKKIDTQIIAKLQENNKNINNNNEEIVKSAPIIKEEIEENKSELNQIKKELSDCSDSEDDSESPESKERKKRMQEQIKKSQQLYALRNLTSCLIKPPKKPTFGDGSDFYPGWEEELYRFKKSLRIPDNLIHVTRPPNCQRLSTSLPDLDPCPSPTNSSIIDEYKIKKKENYDSDIDSNCSFNFSMSKNYDSEEGSSVKSFNIKSRDSILDKLVERYSVKQKRKFKKKDETPKIIPKPENPLELLPTPSLDVENLTEKQKTGAIIKSDSAFLGFRKKTVENFKDTFINTSNIVGVGEQFTPVVLKSRTRKETRVLKQKATIREVFGEDRPASAPPVTCVDELKDIKRNLDEKSDSISPKEVLKNKLLNKGKKLNLINETTCGKIDLDAKSETPSLDGDENISKIIKKNKFRNIRRKGSSGFDYIRKKKKQVKKEDESGTTKQKRFIVKANPESVQDIQKEIKMWVLNKGIGETHLHRSARLGYTDITAYCLEKMDCSPSPKDNAGYTPLHEACSRGHLSTAKLLLMYGANVSESAQGGIRPLHEAIENGFVEIVRLLLSYGADPTLATYAGVTPLSLASDEYTRNLLENHLKEIQGEESDKWFFNGPSKCFDPEESGYDPLEDLPQQDPQLTVNHNQDDLDLDDFDFEVSDVLLPNLYSFINDSTGDRWILLQDLSNLLKIKSKDALLKQINPSGLAVGGTKSVLKELKMTEFLEQVRCCQFLNAGEKINPRASKIALIKYTDKVKELLNVEQVTIPAR